MRYREDMCVGCPPHMGCLGAGCPNRNVLICECDECGDDIDPDDAIEADGKDYCPECYKKLFEEDEDDA